MADRVGQQLGNYRLQRLLGEGGFAEVYLGEHLHLRTLAAIKVLSARLHSEEIERFREEAQMLAHLKHPSIVRVLEFGVEGGVPFLVMDNAAGGTLRQHHPRGTRLAPATILPYVRQVASALQYAHERKLIHRDVKPENMLVGEREEVLLSDFGIATVAQSSRYQSMQDVGGTLAYMAPEQIQGHPRPASDQYALGIVIYEWLAGERPFHGAMNEVVAQQLLTPPPALREKLPDLAPDLEGVVLTALEKDPKERFASIKAFATAFENACQTADAFMTPSMRELLPPLQPISVELSLPLSSPEAGPFPPTPADASSLAKEPAVDSTPVAVETVSSAPDPAMDIQPAVNPPIEPPATLSEAAKPQHRLSRRTLLIAGGIGGVAILGGSSWLAYSLMTPAIGTVVYQYSRHFNAVSAVAWSPDGTRLASASFDKTVQVWGASDGSDVYTYTSHADVVYTVAWSPDGTRIASGSWDNTVQVWDAHTGITYLTYSGHSSAVLGVAWSPNSNRVASASYDRTVQVWNASDSGNVFIYQRHSNKVNAVAWSPDGVYLASGSYDTTVQVWKPSDGSLIYVYPGHSSPVYAVAWSPDGTRMASAGADGTVQVWDALTGKNLLTYRGHSDAVRDVSWSPDGTHIASASADNTVQVWHAGDGSKVYTYRRHANAVYAAAWSPDGKRIASASGDKTVQIWVAS